MNEFVGEIVAVAFVAAVTAVVSVLDLTGAAVAG